MMHTMLHSIHFMPVFTFFLDKTDFQDHINYWFCLYVSRMQQTCCCKL